MLDIFFAITVYLIPIHYDIAGDVPGYTVSTPTYAVIIYAEEPVIIDELFLCLDIQATTCQHKYFFTKSTILEDGAYFYWPTMHTGYHYEYVGTITYDNLWPGTYYPMLDRSSFMMVNGRLITVNAIIFPFTDYSL